MRMPVAGRSVRPAMELRHPRYFVTIAEEQSFSADQVQRSDIESVAAVPIVISNQQARAELAASRARIAAAAHEERRRVVRDLHDGAQQRLVHTVITLKLAQQALAKGEENGP